MEYETDMKIMSYIYRIKLQIEKGQGHREKNVSDYDLSFRHDYGSIGRRNG